MSLYHCVFQSETVLARSRTRASERSVGVMITDEERSIFYLRKDCARYTLYGGPLGNGQRSKEALKSGLEQEIGKWAPWVMAGLRSAKKARLPSRNGCRTCAVFEALLPEWQVRLISCKPPDGGVLLQRDELAALRENGALDECVLAYLASARIL